jgi:integrase
VDVTKLLMGAAALRYRNVSVLIAATGMRRGEALALHWSNLDLNLAAGVLAVRGTPGSVDGVLVISEPKTERSRRNLPLAASLVTMLRAHRAEQNAERLAAGDQWHEHGLVIRR